MESPTRVCYSVRQAGTFALRSGPNGEEGSTGAKNGPGETVGPIFPSFQPLALTFDLAGFNQSIYIITVGRW